MFFKHAILSLGVSLYLFSCTAGLPFAGGGGVSTEKSVPTQAHFVVPDDFNGRVTIVCDPLLAAPLPIVDGIHVYHFDELGFIRVSDYAEQEIRKIRIRAFRRNGEEIEVQWDSSASGRGYLSAVCWNV